jgi:predicted alpha/beta-fold hydrolase
MPVVASTFSPPRWLAGAHTQTILGALLRQPTPLRWERERWELDDGDFLDLDWQRRGHARLAILCHGLEGSSEQGYIRGLAAALARAGWDALAWNLRGCSGTANRLPRFYHSGETGDLRALVVRAAETHDRIALVGFSLGGNIVLKYLGEAPPPPRVVRAAAVSVPIDLASCARRLDREWTNRLYLRRFLAPMRAKIAAKVQRFPEAFEVRGLDRVATFEEFDGRFTGPLHGFRDAEDYWSRSSARQFLPAITVPTLLLNARNDPFLTPHCFPEVEAAASAHVFLEAPASGGHVGFVDGAGRPWWERRVVDWMSEMDTMDGTARNHRP